MENKENILRAKSYKFALRIVNLYKYLMTEKKEYVLSKQVLRSGTSIGANVVEASQAQSKADFVHKLSISLKESFETQYWLDLLRDSAFLRWIKQNRYWTTAVSFRKFSPSQSKQPRPLENEPNGFQFSVFRFQL